MKKVYLFGAGNNAFGVISYIGRENIIAIIDNEKKKQGDNICEIPIISLEEYIIKNDGGQIVITAAMYDEIIYQLEEKNIYNYSIAPMLVRGMASPQEIYKQCGLEKDKNITVFGNNILADKFIEFLDDNYKKMQLQIIRNVESENIKKIDFDKKVINFKEDIQEGEIEFLSKFREKYDAYEIVEQKRKEKMSKLTQFRNKYKNKKCFIVCNGPSLKISDLERLYDDKIYTFGCNLIFNLYSDTYWRPDFYVVCDFSLYKTYYDEISSLRNIGSEMFVKGICDIDGINELEGINYYYEGCRRKYNEDAMFSDDIAKVVYSGFTVAYDMLQIAVYMGFSPIYLIGADFNYNGNASSDGNHVYDYKVKDKRKMAGKSYSDVPVNSMNVARKYAECNGIKIYNATRGGKLDVFERKNLDDLFEELENDKTRVV